MDPRKAKGLRLSKKRPPVGLGPTWRVHSQTKSSTFYTVWIDGDSLNCSCPDFEERQEACKHIYCVQFTITRHHSGRRGA